LRQQSDLPVLLVDADLYTADIDVFLNLFNEHSILDLIRMDQTVDFELLEQVTTEHVSGVRVLQSDSKLQFIDAPVEAGQMAELIEDLIEIWDGYIVINTGNNLNRWTAEILDVVNTVLLVTTPELPALRAMRNFLELAEAHSEPGNKWQLAMNIYQSQKELRMTDIEASIHYEVHYTISQDRDVVSASINRGSPFLLTNSKSPVAKDIVALAQELLKIFPRPEKPDALSDAEASPEKETKRWFSLRQLFVTTLWPT
jgi:pilus assembly protein CpaE